MSSKLSAATIAVAVLLAVSTSAWASPADEAGEMLAQAQALYYEADFAKSIELLLRADELLRNQSGQLQQKAAVKLQLALSYIGLNDRAQAKRHFTELYAIDPDRSLDPQAFSPKVIQLAEEAKAEEGELRCRSVLTQLDQQLAKSEANDAVSLIESNQTVCPKLSSIRPKVADSLFKEGLEAYKKGQMHEALQKFQLALRMDAKHELSSQYVDLTKSKLEVAADRALLAWRKDFNAGDFASAVRDYRDLASHSSADQIDEVRGEYRRILAGLVESWNVACAKNDTVGMEAVRVRVNTMLPESSFAQDLIAKMNKCTPTGCIQMTAPMALARLKNRVNPEFPPNVIAQVKTSPVTVRVKTRINEKGDVTGSDPQGGNPLLYPAVRAAVEQWKFSPAVVQGDARCVDTEIPLTINFTTGK